jgi:hypothetical protein
MVSAAELLPLSDDHRTIEILSPLTLIIWKNHREGSASAVASFELGKGLRNRRNTPKQNARRADYYHLH